MANKKTSQRELDFYAAAYFAAARKRGVKSADDLESIYRRLISPKLGKLCPESISTPKIVRFLESLAASPTPSRARRCKTVLNAVLNYARLHYDELDGLQLPTQGVKAANSRPRTVKLTPSQIGSLLDYLDLRACALQLSPLDAALGCLLFSALRVSELLGLRRCDLSAEGACIKAAIPKTKNGEAHTVFFYGASRVWLSALASAVPQKGFVFASGQNKGASISRQTLYLHWATLQRERFGWEGFTLHDLRRSAASLLEYEHVPLYDVELILNHTHLTSIQASYYQTHEARLRELFGRLAEALEQQLYTAREARMKATPDHLPSQWAEIESSMRALYQKTQSVRADSEGAENCLIAPAQ